MNLFDSFQRDQTTLSKRGHKSNRYFCKNAYLPKEDFMQFSLNDIDNITVSFRILLSFNESINALLI